jgi:hypothetical protein
MLNNERETYMQLSNEFARVRVEVDRSANGDRLRIEDLRTGAVNYLDPLELEYLTTARHRELQPLTNPWR